MLRRSRNNGARSNISNRKGDNSEGHLDARGKTPAHAQQYYEKYMLMACESLAMDDRITAENFYQHAEHYFRLMNEFKSASHDQLIMVS
ncbi:MAG: DUF4167 domain-containing protein [Alphaproteobacteria bacterium]